MTAGRNARRSTRVVDREGNLVGVRKGRRGRCVAHRGSRATVTRLAASQRRLEAACRCTTPIKLGSPLASQLAGISLASCKTLANICNKWPTHRLQFARCFLTSALAARLKATQRTNPVHVFLGCPLRPSALPRSAASSTAALRAVTRLLLAPAALGMGAAPTKPSRERVWVTGASGGLGEEVAAAYAARGCALVLSRAAAARARPRRGALPRGGGAHGRGRAARPGRRGVRRAGAAAGAEGAIMRRSVWKSTQLRDQYASRTPGI